ncbi:MAG: nucleotidyltransferase domain-containing protein [Candidatus Omnitrophica bacterium]|nr:nucleotidyltransferase domain-containing protein [Candidatus Omnitrophota bacterium]
MADLFLNQTMAFYVNELAYRLGLDSGNLTRKLKDLESAGLLRSEMKGRERYYSLNPRFPLLGEYKRIVLKTIGIEARIRDALKKIPGVQRAFLFGSYAENRMDEASDLDLVVIGSHRVLELHKRIALLQKGLSREINLISISPSEYEKKRRSHNFFKALEKRRRVKLL